jgi:hypothetical protein
MEQDPLLLLLLLQLVALTFAVWLCQGDVLLLLGFGRVTGRADGGPAAVPLDREEVIPAEIQLGLRELRFAPAGLYWESATLHHREFHEYIFASATGDCLASVYQLFGNEPPRVAFFTAFSDGACVFTRNYMGGLTANEETLLAGGLSPDANDHPLRPEQRPPLARVLDEHRHRLRRFILAGRSPLPCATVDDYVAGQHLYHGHATVMRQFRAAVLVLFSLKVVFLGLGPVVVALSSGIGSLWPWAFLFVNCLIVGLFRRYGAWVIAALDNLPAPSQRADARE